jgi:hypothetical protein
MIIKFRKMNHSRILRSVVLLLAICCCSIAWSQGCSDAGFCTMPSIKPEAVKAGSGQRNQIKTGLSFGQGDQSVAVAGLSIEYGRKLGTGVRMDAKLTTLQQRGNGITATGLSDLFLSSSFELAGPFTFTVGAKLPLSNGNRRQNGLPLPMDYQSSLGTFDLITGLSAAFGQLQLAAAWQQPLSQNSNSFSPDLYPAGSPLRKFVSTRAFKRSGDVLLRAAYTVKVSKPFSITPGLLPIFHLANDRYTDNSGTAQIISGSQGLTLNSNLFLDYRLSETRSLQLNFGIPIVVRDVRPDGLTRSFAANLEYQYRF